MVHEVIAIVVTATDRPEHDPAKMPNEPHPRVQEPTATTKEPPEKRVLLQTITSLVAERRVP